MTSAASTATGTAPVVKGAGLRAGPVAVAVGSLVGAVLSGVLIGPVSLSPSAVGRELLDALPFVDLPSGLSPAESAILWQLRLPRVALGGVVGSVLALSGAAYQGVFRNPLADPYLLGVAAGAGLGVTVAVAYGPDLGGISIDPRPLAAFVGALVAVAATYALGRSAGRTRTAATLILAGVAIASFLTAVQTFVQQQESETLRQVYTWILGTLSTAGWDQVLLVLPYATVAVTMILVHRRLLDVLSVGDEEADSLGVRSTRVRLFVVAAASLGTAAAVAVSGLIGFVGIIVPHTIRLAVGSSYRLVLPLSVAFGGAFLILSDLLGRTVVAPAEIPIGVVTAFFGAPFFLVILRRSRRLG
jgi:iron complex transport system permease protein